MKVRDPDGRTWRVTRRWTPWRRRVKDVVDVSPDLPTADDPSGLLLVLVGILLVPLVVTVALLVAELLLLVALLPLAVLGRVLLGRRWVVEVREGFRPRYEELTGDWGRAGDRIEELAGQLQRGDFTVPRDPDDPDDPDKVVRHDPGPPADLDRRRPGQEW